MGDMGVFLTTLGVVFGGVIVWIVYTNISNNMAKNSKNIAKKAEIIMKKDMSSKCARCTFYMNNDYDNGYSQSEWLNYYKESTLGLEKDSQEYAEAVAPIINAIVVGGDGYYVRRGMENRVNALERFQPGLNDRISLNFFVEPYKYVHNEKLAAKSLAEQQLRREEYKESARMQPQPQSQSQQKKGLSVFERAELQSARTRYAKAVDEHKRNKNSSSAIHYEAIEKRAFADLMRIEAKYAGRE